MSLLENDRNLKTLQRTLTPRPLSINSVTSNSSVGSGSEGSTITIRGSGFAPGSAILLGDVLEAEYIDETTCRATVSPKGDKASIIMVRSGDGAATVLHSALQLPPHAASGGPSTRVMSSLMKPDAVEFFGCSSPGITTAAKTVRGPLIAPEGGHDVGAFMQAIPRQYDLWRFYTDMVPGKYVLWLRASSKATNRGIVSLVINDKVVGSVDLYDASYFPIDVTEIPFTITDTGNTKIELQVNDKNGGSSDYVFTWRGATIIHVGD